MNETNINVTYERQFMLEPHHGSAAVDINCHATFGPDTLPEDRLKWRLQLNHTQLYYYSKAIKTN